MATIVRFVDPDDRSEVRLDLHDLIGANTTAGMRVLARDFNLGELATTAEFLDNPQVDGGRFLFGKLPNSEMSFRLRIKGSSTDDWIARGRALATELQRDHNMLEIKLDGSSTSIFIKTYKSPVPSILSATAFPSVVRKDIPDGVLVVIRRHPKAILEELIASDQKLLNATLLIDLNADGTPDTWSGWDRGTTSYVEVDGEYVWQHLANHVNGDGSIYQDYTVGAAQALTFQAESKRIAGPQTAATRLHIEAYQNTTFLAAVTSGWLTAGEFTRHTLSYTTPANTTKVRVWLQTRDDCTVQWRKAQLNHGLTALSFRVGPEVIRNDARCMFVYNPGNLPAEAQVFMEPEAGSKITDVYVSRRSNGNVVEFASKCVFDLATAATLGVDTSVVSDAEMGNVLETNFTNTPSMRRRWRLVINPTDNNFTLKGKYRAHVVMRVTSTDEVNNPPTAIFGMQLRSKERDDSGVTPTEDVTETIRYDAEELTTYRFAEVNLGVVNIDEGVDKLVLEGWAKRRLQTGSGRIRWAYLVLVPLESFTRIAVPGVDEGASHPTVWRGNELAQMADGTGGDGFPSMHADSRSKDFCELGAQGDKVGTTGEVESSSGEGMYIPLDVGRHHFKVLVALENDDETRIRAGYFAVRKRTGAGTSDLIDRIPIYTRDEHWFTRKEKKITFDVATPGDYRATFEIDHNGSEAPTAAVLYIRHSFERYATDSEQLVFDAYNERRVLRNKIDKQRICTLQKRGPWLMLPPGLSLLQFGIGEELGPGYDDVIDGRSLTRFRESRGMTVKVDIFSRAYPL